MTINLTDELMRKHIADSLRAFADAIEADTDGAVNIRKFRVRRGVSRPSILTGEVMFQDLSFRGCRTTPFKREALDGQ